LGGVESAGRGGINLSLRRNFGLGEIQEWEHLEGSWVRLLCLIWKILLSGPLSPNGVFSTSSLYRHCSFPGVVDVRMEELWNSKLPLKIRIQTVDNLRKKE
jgi:hypothetical protein